MGQFMRAGLCASAAAENCRNAARPSAVSGAAGKVAPPRAPRKIVGRSASTRGPVGGDEDVGLEPLFQAVADLAQPGDPISSPISTSTWALKPSDPRAAITACIAVMLTSICPLLSAMPRPYQPAGRGILGQGPGSRPSAQRPAMPGTVYAMGVAQHCRTVGVLDAGGERNGCPSEVKPCVWKPIAPKPCATWAR